MFGKPFAFARNSLVEDWFYGELAKVPHYLILTPTHLYVVEFMTAGA